ncbi:MAG TPA: SDR family NAD(P)-dependent oxidoreductase, partial [Burkholderiales bacterium]|nr:SDR family NAD(P)-dependent oxidoreductase [Burkholderiales bacterium]
MPTALITGAGRGLGKELARQYAADGWEVIGTMRRQLEMTDREQISGFAKQLKGKPIDLLFCNAGIIGKRGMKPGSFDFDSWEEVLRVNLLGPAALADALLDNVAASERRIIA